MAVLNFPSSPSNGDNYVENGVTYTYTGTHPNGFWKADNQNYVTDIYMSTAGDTMTGNLLITPLGGGGNVALYADNNGQLRASAGSETLVSPFVDKAGSTMTGNLVFAGAQITSSGGKARFGGTGTPDELLELYSTGSDVALELNYNDSKKAKIELSTSGDLEIRGTDGAIKFFRGNADGDSSTELASFTTGGQLLVGTSTASSYADRLLSVGDTSQTNSVIEVRSSTTGDGAVVFSDGVANDNSGYRGSIAYDHTNDLMQIRTAGNIVSTIDSSGNVGIGTASPGDYLASAHQFVISDSASTGITIATPTSSSGTIAFADGTGAADNARGLIRYGHSDNSLQFSTNAEEQMRIDSSGKMGIGTTNPTDLLHIKNGGIKIQPNSDTDTNYISFRNAADGLTKGYVAYKHADSALSFRSTGAAEQMRLDSAGRLLLGTTTDYGVAATLAGDGTSTSTGAGSYAVLSVADTNAGAEGVGGGVAFQGNDGVNTLVTFSQVQGYKQNATIGNYAGGLKFSTRENSSAITERMRIDSSGRMGLGTASPSTNLHVVSSGATEIKSESTGDNALISINNSSSVPWILTQRNDTTNGLSFRYNGNNYVNIDTSGRLLVGTTSNQGGYLLQVKDSDISTTKLTGAAGGNAVQMLRFRVHNTSNTAESASLAGISAETVTNWGGSLTFHTKPTNSTPNESLTERMRLNSDGLLTTRSQATGGIEVAQQNVAGTSNYLYRGGHSSTGLGLYTASFQVSTNGNVENTNNSYGALSDIKLKENIVDAKSQWDDIKAIQFRNYNLKEETGHETFTQLGVIAQELEQISPGLVGETPDMDYVTRLMFDDNGAPVVDENGNQLSETTYEETGTVTKNVKYSVLYMKAMVALQEAMERIELLEARVTDLLS